MSGGDITVVVFIQPFNNIYEMLTKSIVNLKSSHGPNVFWAFLGIVCKPIFKEKASDYLAASVRLSNFFMIEFSECTQSCTSLMKLFLIRYLFLLLYLNITFYKKIEMFSVGWVYSNLFFQSPIRKF